MLLFGGACIILSIGLFATFILLLPIWD